MIINDVLLMVAYSLSGVVVWTAVSEIRRAWWERYYDWVWVAGLHACLLAMIGFTVTVMLMR